MIHRIYSVKALDNFEIEVTFYTGEVKEYDVKRLAKYEERYRELLKDKEQFRNVKVLEYGKGVCWNNNSKTAEYDIASENIWFEGVLARITDIDEDMMTVARKFTVMREQMRMTQKELSEKSGVNQGDISRIERGTSNPSIRTLSRLARTMGYSLDIDVKKAGSNEDEMITSGNIARYLPSWKRQGDYTLSDIERLPDGVHAELIDGVICDMAPPNIHHQRIASILLYEFTGFIKKNKGGCEAFLAGTGIIRSPYDKYYFEPDLVVVCNKDNILDRYIVSPDFVLEITSPSTSLRDYGEKAVAYRKIGVKEYWIIDTDKECLWIYYYENSGVVEMHTFDESVGIKIYNEELVIDMSVFKKSQLN